MGRGDALPELPRASYWRKQCKELAMDMYWWGHGFCMWIVPLLFLVGAVLFSAFCFEALGWAGWALAEANAGDASRDSEALCAGVK
jgi:hypothetical protein